MPDAPCPRRNQPPRAQPRAGYPFCRKPPHSTGPLRRYRQLPSKKRPENPAGSGLACLTQAGTRLPGKRRAKAEGAQTPQTFPIVPALPQAAQRCANRRRSSPKYGELLTPDTAIKLQKVVLHARNIRDGPHRLPACFSGFLDRRHWRRWRPNFTSCLYAGRSAHGAGIRQQQVFLQLRADHVHL